MGEFPSPSSRPARTGSTAVQESRLQLMDDFKAFSAMRCAGTPAEVARAVRWLACENTYLSG